MHTCIHTGIGAVFGIDGSGAIYTYIHTYILTGIGAVFGIDGSGAVFFSRSVPGSSCSEAEVCIYTCMRVCMYVLVGLSRVAHVAKQRYVCIKMYVCTHI